MNKIKDFFKENKFILTIFIITIFILILPNLHKDLVIGDDYIYHTARIQGIADSLKNGVFPIKINSTMANSFGYASSTFYPDLFLYIPAIIMILFNIDIIIGVRDGNGVRSKAGTGFGRYDSCGGTVWWPKRVWGSVYRW